MIEQIVKLSTDDKKAVKKDKYDENLHYILMVFNKEEGLPEHVSDSNVYMTVVRGAFRIGLGDERPNEYVKGTLLKIPKGVKMNVGNKNDETLELIVVKAPAPGK